MEEIQVVGRCSICEYVNAIPPSMIVGQNVEIKQENEIPMKVIRPPILKRSLLNPVETNNNAVGSNKLEDPKTNSITTINMNNEKIHQCARCSYVSNNVSNLARHIASIHVDLNCNYCDLSVNGRYSLFKHLKDVHGMKKSLRAYFDSLDGKIEEEVKKSPTKPPVLKKKRKPYTRKPKPTVQEPLVHPMPQDVMAKMQHDLALKVDACFEKSIDRFLGSIKHRVEVLPIHYRVSAWENRQNFNG